AVRLLQRRQTARQTPDAPAVTVVEPLLVEVLARYQHTEAATMTAARFWRRVAQLGGHQGRRRDGPPGWRTLWRGWRRLADLTEGARLFA
ncbi:MAG TPA: IS4 family transposase, partial [Anaerolineae bacterium]|nr:IS4 family transposase [Anaerolineae bacterium]